MHSKVAKCIEVIYHFTDINYCSFKCWHYLLGKLKSVSWDSWYRMKVTLGSSLDALLAWGVCFLPGRSQLAVEWNTRRPSCCCRQWAWGAVSHPPAAPGMPERSHPERSHLVPLALGGFLGSERGPLHHFWNQFPVGPLNCVPVAGCQTHKAPPASITSVPNSTCFFFSLLLFQRIPRVPFGHSVGERRVGESLEGHLCLEAAPLAFSPPLNSCLSNGQGRFCWYDPGERPA